MKKRAKTDYMKLSIQLLFILLLHSITFAQLTVSPYNGGTGNNGAPVANLIPFVQTNFAQTGIVVTNATYIGKNYQLGTFNSTNTVLFTNYGFDAGIILGTGPVTNAIGPNTEPYAAGVQSYTGDNTDDADLHAIAGAKVKDRSILAFDFTSDWDTVTFNFIFGSEEYPEFVNQYNDPFGFFLSGPGISGPFSGGAINLAIVPGTSTPISINSVNNGSSSTGTFVPNCMNCAYYVYNGDPGNGTTVNPYKSNNQYIQYDGYTVMMTAKAVVQCGQTYHIKLAIADARDESYDSGVMIRGNLSTLPPTQNQTIAANCSGGNITLNPNGPPGSTYAWSTGQTSPTISISPSAYSGQTITVTITNSCNKTRTVNYTISCPLAAVLASFDATNQQTAVALSWKTESEKETDHFEVYRSEDGLHFEQINSIQASGNTNIARFYDARDERPLAGISYYKLGIVNKQGEREYSEVKSVQRLLSDGQIHIIPNPASELLSIGFTADQTGACSIQITDALGKVVYEAIETVQKGMKTWNLDATTFDKGIYQVTVRSTNSTLQSKLIIR